MAEENNDNQTNDRRNFLRAGLFLGGSAVAGTILSNTLSASEETSGEKVKVMTAEGQLVEVDRSKIKIATDTLSALANNDERKGIPGKKWVMVIDLSRCKNARKCQSACNKAHALTGPNQWLKVYEMQDNEESSPYWMPKPCLHCDNPPCTKVCPVDATFKREDGIVAIDNERCIGCRFCMAACPYSTRVFNWEEPKQPIHIATGEHTCATSQPRKKGVVEKCDFCPHMLEQGKLPHCVTACPNGVFFMGDENEDTVTNGSETFALSQLLRDKAGYRYMEDLGTKPRVYYLPPVDRLFPFTKEDKEKTEE